MARLFLLSLVLLTVGLLVFEILRWRWRRKERLRWRQRMAIRDEAEDKLPPSSEDKP